MAGDTEATNGNELGGGLQQDRKVTELLYRVLRSEAIVRSALEVTNVVGPLKTRLVKSHLSGESPEASLLRRLNVLQFDDEKTLEYAAVAMADQVGVNVEMVIAASVLILSHSAADDVFTGACQFSMERDPQDWISALNLDRKVTLRDLREKGADRLFADEVQLLRSSVGNKALPSRAQLLFRHVKIVHHREIPSDDPRYFRASTLEEADELRHKVVHGNGLPAIPVVRAEELAGFLHEAAHTALRSLAYAYSLKPDFAYLRELYAKQEGVPRVTPTPGKV